jgi:hypothetical protein
METRALAIAIFYAVGTGIGGIIGPLVFAPAVATGKYADVARAMALGAILMIAGGVVELAWGVKAERRRLEGIAKPLTAIEAKVRNAAHRHAGAASAATSPTQTVAP